MASTPRTQGRPFLTPGQGSEVAESTGEATTKDRIADAIATRCRSLDTIKSGGVLDLAASVVVILHEQLNGRASSLSGHRSPNHRREQLRGEDALTVEDLAYLAIEAPRAVVLALEPLARQAGCRIVPATPTAFRVNEALARVAESHGGLQAAAHRANADGVIEAHEAESLLRNEVQALKRRNAELEASLAQHGHELEMRDVGFVRSR